MAVLPPRNSEDARGEIDRLFAEMPGAPAALVLMVATRGRLDYSGSRDDSSDATGEAFPTPGPVTPRDQSRAGRDERVGQV